MKKTLCALLVAVTVGVVSCGPSEIVVTNRPSPPHYVRPMSPGPGYVWIEGDWVIHNGRYQWREGRWVRRRNHVWISGSWESRNNGYYWRRGHWR